MKLKLLALFIIVLSGCPKSSPKPNLAIAILNDRATYQVISVELDRHSNVDTYKVIAAGYRKVHAASYSYVSVGDQLCSSGPGLLSKKYDDKKPCLAGDDNTPAIHMTENIDFATLFRITKAEGK